MAGNIPSRSGKRQHAKREKHEGCDLVARLPAMLYPINKGQGRRFWTTANEPQ